MSQFETVLEHSTLHWWMCCGSGQRIGHWTISWYYCSRCNCAIVNCAIVQLCSCAIVQLCNGAYQVVHQVVGLCTRLVLRCARGVAFGIIARLDVLKPLVMSVRASRLPIPPPGCTWLHLASLHTRWHSREHCTAHILLHTRWHSTELNTAHTLLCTSDDTAHWTLHQLAAMITTMGSPGVVADSWKNIHSVRTSRWNL